MTSILLAWLLQSSSGGVRFHQQLLFCVLVSKTWLSFAQINLHIYSIGNGAVMLGIRYGDSADFGFTPEINAVVYDEGVSHCDHCIVAYATHASLSPLPEFQCMAVADVWEVCVI